MHNLKSIEIPYRKTNEILFYIRKAVQLISSKTNPKDIRMLIPDYLQGILLREHEIKVIQRSENTRRIEQKKLYGVEILPHYKNEVVVFNIKNPLFENAELYEIIEI